MCQHGTVRTIPFGAICTLNAKATQIPIVALYKHVCVDLYMLVLKCE